MALENESARSWSPSRSPAFAVTSGVALLSAGGFPAASPGRRWRRDQPSALSPPSRHHAVADDDLPTSRLSIVGFAERRIGQREHAARRQHVERRPVERFGVREGDVAARTESLGDVGAAGRQPSPPAARRAGGRRRDRSAIPSGARRCATCRVPVGGTAASTPAPGRGDSTTCGSPMLSVCTFSGLLSSAKMTSSSAAASAACPTVRCRA